MEGQGHAAGQGTRAATAATPLLHPQDGEEQLQQHEQRQNQPGCREQEQDHERQQQADGGGGAAQTAADQGSSGGFHRMCCGNQQTCGGGRPTEYHFPRTCSRTGEQRWAALRSEWLEETTRSAHKRQRVPLSM
eukprot:81641-Chlamydomonas_euryale.AAC.15